LVLLFPRSSLNDPIYIICVPRVFTDRSENKDHFFHCEIVLTTSLEEEERLAHLDRRVCEKLKTEVEGGSKKKLVINLQSTNKREVLLVMKSSSFFSYIFHSFMFVINFIYFYFSFIAFPVLHFCSRC
jgi:hypothetical protein